MTNSQRAHLLAGLTGCHLRTAEKHLRGEPVKGAYLQERLAAAMARVDSMTNEPKEGPASLRATSSAAAPPAA